MAGNSGRTLTVTILGDAQGVQRAFREAGDGAGNLQAKLGGFEGAFRSAGVTAGVAAAATSAGLGLIEDAARAAGDAIFNYSASVQQAEARLAGINKNAAVTAEQLALARREADAGHGTYLALADAIAGLAPAARASGAPMADLLALAEQLAASNPEEGLKGAAFALREAASGDFTSVIERFNLSRVTINRLKDEGVPALEAVRRAMQEQGIDAALVTEQSKTFNAQQEILLGTLKQLAAEGGKPIFDATLAGLKELNAALKTPASRSFVSQLAEELQIIISGNFFADLGLQGVKAIYLLTDAYNNFLKAVSGGRIEISPDALAGFRKMITDQEGAIRQDVRKAFGEPVAAELAGTAPGSPLAPATVQGYGREILRQYLAGMSPEQGQEFARLWGAVGKDFKAGSDEAAGALSILAVAFREVQAGGQLSETVLYRLASAFGKNTEQVTALLNGYRQFAGAQQAATQAQSAAGAAQAGANTAIALGSSILNIYTQQLTAATNAAEQHANAHKGIVDGLTAESRTVARAAQERQQGYQDEIDGLQKNANAQQELARQHSDASAAAVAAAQADVQATRDRAQAHAGLLQAVLKGETEEYLRQLAVIDDETRALAEKWEAEIGGQARARAGANERVGQLTRQQHKEDLEALRAIQAARASGNEAEARRLERQRAAAQKKSAGALELARAEQAVAQDNYDEAAARLEKEGKAVAEKDLAATRAAEKRLAETQAQGEAQRKADEAALKAIQDQIAGVHERQQADQRATQARQQGIQDEIDKENTRYGIQQAGDKAAADALRTLIGDRKTYWQQEVTQIGAVAAGYAAAATHAASIAKSMQDAYTWLYGQYQLYANNPPGSPTGPPVYTPGPTPLRGPEATGTPDNPAVAPRPGGGAGGGGGGGGRLDPGGPITVAGLRDGGATGYDLWRDVVRGGYRG